MSPSGGSGCLTQLLLGGSGSRPSIVPRNPLKGSLGNIPQNGHQYTLVLRETFARSRGMPYAQFRHHHRQSDLCYLVTCAKQALTPCDHSDATEVPLAR